MDDIDVIQTRQYVSVQPEISQVRDEFFDCCEMAANNL